MKKNGQVAYNAEVEEKVNTSENSIGNGSGFTNSADDRDAYFADAGKFIIEKEKGSIGMLQRMFKIGFNRAARIMDQLEEAGVVGSGGRYKATACTDESGRISAGAERK